jgi:hypothetical protein
LVEILVKGFLIYYFYWINKIIMYKKLFFLVFVLPMTLSLSAQYNFDAGFPVVYNILNTKCSNATCHSVTSSDALKFDGSSATVYAALVGQPPVNANALARGEQLVWLDQPYQSYMLKKAGSWFDTDLSLPVGEPDSAAHVSAGLSNVEVEYIRQWIMNGSAQTGLTIDTSIINAYYNPADTGQIPFFPKLPIPNTGNVQQVRYGPIFLRNTPGNNEVEYMLVHQINFPENTEVIGLESNMSSMSHHFLLFQFPDSAAAAPYMTGFRRVILGATTVSPFDPPTKNIIAAWQTPSNIELPYGTALYWAKNTYIDQDYHVKNYTPIVAGTSGIVPFDFYMNLTYRPRVVTDNTIEMKSALINNPAFDLLPHKVTTIPYSDPSNTNNEMRYIWMISSHTHKFGTGFNIYKFDSTQNGNFGDTLYKGTYDYTAGIDLGYYDWEHPSVEYFNTQYPMNMATNGLICQTTWDNDSSNIVTFGFTTANEMQLFYYMYTSELPAAAPSGVQTVSKGEFDFVVYPNPMSDMGTLSYTLVDAATVNASIIDITGKEVATLKNEKEQAGSYNVNLGQGGILSSGMYFAKMSVNGVSYTKKFVVQ